MSRRNPWKAFPRSAGAEVRILCQLCGEMIGSIYRDEAGNVVAETMHARRRPEDTESAPAVVGSHDRLRSASPAHRRLEVSTLVATCPSHGPRTLAAPDALRAFDQGRRNVRR